MLSSGISSSIISSRRRNSRYKYVVVVVVTILKEGCGVVKVVRNNDGIVRGCMWIFMLLTSSKSMVVMFGGQF